MLVLTRKMGESVVIGREANISVTLLKVEGGQARIGIDAPKDVPIHREEVHKRITNGTDTKQ